MEFQRNLIKKILSNYNIPVKQRAEYLKEYADKITYDDQTAIFIKDENDFKYLLIIENKVTRNSGYLVPYGKYKIKILVEENREYFSKFYYDKEDGVIIKSIINNNKYWVTEDGKVVSLNNKKILSSRINNRGYYSCIIYDTKNKKYKNYVIHRLVAEAFIPNPNNKPEVNHIDGVKTNNHYTNLEWCTSSENQIHAYKLGLQKSKKGQESHRAKFTNKEILEIRKLFNLNIMDVKKIANLYNVSVRTIWNILEYNTYKNSTDEKEIPKYISLSRTERGGENYRTAQLTNRQANEIRELYINEQKTIPELSKLYNVKSRVIWKILQYKTYKTNEKYSKIYTTMNKNERKGCYASLAKLTNEQANEIRELFKSGKYTHQQLADIYNVKRLVILNIVNNKTYIL